MATKNSWIFAICLLLTYTIVTAHIPMSYSYKSAEPDAPIYTGEGITSKLTREASVERLAATRAVLAEAGVDAYIVPTGDAHNSQYIALADARREWVSGLRGSSGTAVVTTSRALLWTDARYWTQFDVEVNAELWELMRQGTDLSIQQWLVQNMQAGSTVALDPTTYTRSEWNSLETALSAVNVRLLAIYGNLIDEARRRINDGPPERPNNALLPLTMQYSGRSSSNKISQVIEQINNVGASALLLTALDDVAYTLNLRGTDIPYNPVFFAYLLIRADTNTNNVILFWNDGELSADVVTHLASEGTAVQCRPYEEIFDYLTTFSNELGAQGSIWVPSVGSHAVYLAIEQGPARIIVAAETPVALAKIIKNDVELQDEINCGAKRRLRMRSNADVEEENFMGPSFATIAGAGANGAIIHYKPNPEGVQTVIQPNDMLLVDSGGQYLEGTTDITRTRHMSSSPTEAQRVAFTRVLKGQISLGTVVLPSGTTGNVVEVLARRALWDIGLNYGHGTGHGVGHFLNVHEGPAWILSGPTANDPGIRPAMIFSNEPGYYEVGEYGIRHEDLVETIQMNTNADHPMAADLVGDFEGRGAVGFHTISLAPHQTACLDMQLMSDFEIKFLNDYHARVLNTLGPILQERGLNDEFEWLEKECAPISRSAAILVKSTPLLAGISVIFVWLGM